MLISKKSKIKYLKKFDLSGSVVECQGCPMDNDLFTAFLKENNANKDTVDYFKISSCLIRFAFLSDDAVNFLEDYSCSNRIEALQRSIYNIKSLTIENE